MIWSVSMFGSGSGAAMLVSVDGSHDFVVAASSL
jgi:hypothetical protein